MALKAVQNVENIDKMIRAGQGEQAKKEVWKIARLALPREQRLPIATLCRRVGLYSLGVRLLNSLIRPTGKSVLEASDKEKAEYAALLTYLCANEEALVILRKLSPKSLPEVSLYQAFALFNQWNYTDAIPCLESYLQSDRITEYQRLIGELNLAAALVYERNLKLAGPLLDNLVRKTKNEDTKLLHGNTLELLGQLELFSKDYSKARDFLIQSKNILNPGHGLGHAYTNKWLAILELMEGKDPNALAKLLEVKSSALKFGYSEVVRDCDRFMATECKDQALLENVYFGTPFTHYRNRLLYETSAWFRPGSKHSRLLGKSASRCITLDLSSYRLPIQLHRLFSVLASDFYRPFTIASLHTQIFENEYYHPTATPTKIHKLIQRLRKEFKKDKVPLTISQVLGFYELKSEKSCELVVYLQDKTYSPLTTTLRNHFGSRPFCSEEAAKIAQVTSRTILRLLKQEISCNRATKTGSGPSTQYLFLSENDMFYKKVA